jgi:hypothetical protein
VVKISFPAKVPVIDAIPLPVLVLLTGSVPFGRFSVPFPEKDNCIVSDLLESRLRLLSVLGRRVAATTLSLMTMTM